MNSREPSTSGEAPVDSQWSATFKGLGVTRYRAALPTGRIEWFDVQGREVAQAACRVVCSYSAADRTLLWGWADRDLAASHVPVIAQPQRSASTQLDDIEVARAETLAVEAAIDDGCAFVYRARAGALVIFLGITEFSAGKAGVEVSGEPVAAGLARYAQLVSERAKALLKIGGERAEVAAALRAAARATRETAEAWGVSAQAGSDAARLDAEAASVEAGQSDMP